MSNILVHLFSGIMSNLATSWVIILTGPVVILTATLFAKGIESIYENARYSSFFLRPYFGDIRWVFPLNNKEKTFNLT